MIALSDHPLDKLHAALNHAYPDTDSDLGAPYRAACQLWYERLTECERRIMLGATAAFENGNGEEAAKNAAQLPAAPVFPARLF